MKNITIYTDGSCLGNPGNGGWSAIINYNGIIKEISGGFKNTTNNRMEIMGVINSLKILKESCNIELYTDSQYVCNSIEKKWIYGWIKKGWKTSTGSIVKNKDLWEQLYPLINFHHVKFNWVKGHDGNENNERCDYLAKTEASKTNLMEDINYSKSH